MRLVFAAFLVAHAVAHLVGFVGPWGLAGSVPGSRTLLAGKLVVGDAVMKVVGLVWLVVAVAFVIAAIGLLRQAAWWRPVTVAAAGASLGLSVLCWPQSILGVPINGFVLAVLFATADSRWPLSRT